MRLHPAPDLKNCVDYVWYASRISAMTNCPELYGPDGWTVASQKCFEWLATVPDQKIRFKIKRWKAEQS